VGYYILWAIGDSMFWVFLLSGDGVPSLYSFSTWYPFEKLKGVCHNQFKGFQAVSVFMNCIKVHLG
jgi:hypothetical protein